MRTDVLILVIGEFALLALGAFVIWLTIKRDQVLASNDKKIQKDNEFLYEYCQHLENRLYAVEFALYEEEAE